MLLTLARRAAITQARPAARFVGDVVLEVTGGGGAPADRAGAGRVPDLGQVPQLDPGIMAFGLEPVVTVAGGDRVERDGQIWLSAGPGAQCPGAVSAGRSMLAGSGERESRTRGAAGRIAPVRWAVLAWFVPASAVVLGFGSGAAVPDGVALLVGDGHAPGGLRVAGGGAGQVAGQGGVDRADAADLAGSAGQAEQGGPPGWSG